MTTNKETEKLDLNKLPEDIRGLLFTEWDMDRAFEEATKKLDKIRIEMKEHRNRIKNLSPEKQVIYWKAISEHYGDIFKD